MCFSRGDYRRMDKEITKRDHEYKKKWANQHRHTKMQKTLLKDRWKSIAAKEKSK